MNIITPHKTLEYVRADENPYTLIPNLTERIYVRILSLALRYLEIGLHECLCLRDI